MTRRQRTLRRAAEMSQHLKQLTQLVTAAWATSSAADRAFPEASAPKVARPSLEELRAQEAEMITRLEDTFVQEALAPAWAWSADSQEHISARVAAAALPGTVVVGIECRTVSCRVEAVHDSQDAMDTFVTHGGRLMPWDADGMTQMLPEGRGQYRTISYFKHVRE